MRFTKNYVNIVTFMSHIFGTVTKKAFDAYLSFIYMHNL